MTEPIAFRPPSAPGFVSGRGRGCARPAGRAGGWRAAVLAFAVAFPGWVSTRAGEFVREPGRAPNVFVAVPVEEGGSALAAAGEVIVRIRDDARRRPADLAARFGEGRLRWLGSRGRGGRPAAVGGGRSLLEGWATLRLPAGADLGGSVEALGRLPEVESVEPNWRVELAVEPGKAPNDMEFGRQWALNNTGQTGGRAGADIRALEAWGVSTGSREVVVAIVDTGIDYFHPDLEPNLWVNPREVAGNGIDDDGNGYIDDVRGFDFVSDDGDPLDDNLHGTHVAGILGAVGNDEQGVAGVAWSVQMMALKAFDEGGGGTLDDTLEAVAYAVANGARVVNASWGLTTRSRALDEIVARAVASGVVFVAAAGNNGSTVRFFPAAVPEAIAVGATDARDGSPGFSNHGPFVDLVAPGESIQSTALNGSWTTLSGTSMAAPHVSGVVALLLSRRPSFTPDDLAMILRSTVDEIATDRYTGAGRLQAARAVNIDEPLPTARLAVPAQWSGRIDLPGEAGGHRFAGYRLELGAGSRPERWDELAAGGTPTAAGVVLAGFDTARFDDGEYVVRLVVSNRLGQAAVERVPVAIRNIRMSTPQNNDVTRHGESLEIRGTVYGEGRVFAVEWGLGWRPSVWRTDGVEIEGGGAAPVVEGVLARWDTRLAPPDAFVAFRLTARRGERRVGESFAEMVHLGARLRPGWPRRFDFTDEFPESNWRQFNVADLDGDGRSEIVLVDHGESGGRPPRLLALEADGSVRWSRVLPSGTPEFDAPVIGDVDGDGRAEVFVDTGSQGLVSAFDAEGRPLGGGWPMAPGGTHLGKVVADLDGDGRAELITLSNPPAELEDTRQRRLTVVDRDGVVVRQWSLGWCEDEARVPELLPAVVDLDEDPALELVAVDGCLGVSAFDLERPEGPVWTALTAANLFASPVTGDLDGDGREEVVIGGVSRGAGRPGGVHVFDHRGQPRPGWPALENESFHASAALADLDLDGRLDVVIPNWDTDVVHVFGADGFELRGWPTPRQANASVRGFPVVGDVTGDGWPEVVLASPGHWLSVVLSGATERSGGIRAWAFDGMPIDFQPLAPPDGLAMESSGGGMLRLPSAALADLDGDGRLDLVAGTLQDSAYSSTPPVTRPKMRSSLYAWSLPVGVGERRGWPMAQGGPGRTGRFQRHRPPNQPPVLLPIPDQTVAQGDAFRVVLLDRYVVDPDGDERRLVWSAQSTGDLGVTIGPDRVARFEVPRPDWVGRETVRFVVRDAGGGEAAVSVVVSARAGYVAPTAAPDRGTTEEEQALELELVANDTSPEGRPLRVLGVSRPGSGQAEVLADGRVRYRPATNFFGTDRFEYTVIDDDGGAATGEVEVEVVGRADAPVAERDRVILDEDGVGELDLLGNDVDPDGDELAVASIGTPAEGAWEDLGRGRLRYRPPPDFSGLVSFPYSVRDPSGLTATGEVSVLVRPVNDVPVARNQTVALNRNRTTPVIYDASDVDGDPLSYTVVDGPSDGVLLVYPTVANYEPRKGFTGDDRFTYTVSDGRVSVGPVTVHLTVRDANNPPDVESVSTVTAVEQPVTIPLRAVDADGEAVALLLEAAPSHGAVTFLGTNAVYTPAPGFLGEDRFEYRGRDGTETSAPASVSIRVTDENTAPTALPEVLTVARNATTPVLLRARDAENNPLDYLVVEAPERGGLAGQAPRLEYTPRVNFRGIDRFRFVARDRWLTSEVAIVHLLVRDPNQAPVVTNQTVVVRRDTPLGFSLRATDADGHRLRAAILKGPRSGRLFGGDTVFTYAPAAGFVGRDVFTYKVWDGYTYSAVATVTVLVDTAPPEPVRILEVKTVGEGIEITLRTEGARRVRLEASEDLTRWETVAAWERPEGVLRWIDVEGARRAGRWFRALAEVD